MEHALSLQDTLGTHYVNTSRFKEFLRQLNKFGNLSPKDINLVCRHFSRRHLSPQYQHLGKGEKEREAVDEERDPVSLKEVLAFLGMEYVGNLQLRIQRCLKGEYDAQRVLQILQTITNTSSSAPASSSTLYSYDTIETLFNTMGVYTVVSHDQVRAILHKLDAHSAGKLTIVQVLAYLDIPFKASDFAQKAAPEPEPEASASVKGEPVPDVETLLRALLDKVGGTAGQYPQKVFLLRLSVCFLCTRFKPAACSWTSPSATSTRTATAASHTRSSPRLWPSSTSSPPSPTTRPSCPR